MSGIARILRVYEAVQSEQKPGTQAGEFATTVMRKLGIEVSARGAENLQGLKGPLLFVANHPFGVLDALGLMQVMKGITPDFRFVANQEVGRVSELREALIPMQIDDHLPMQGANAVQLRKTLCFLRAGGVVGVFPAGEVAAFNSLRSSRTTEKVWSSHVARLAVASRATIVPVYFPGRNSLFFQWVGLLVPQWRVILLLRELTSVRSALRLEIRPVFTPDEVARFQTPELLTAAMRVRVFSAR